MREFKIELSLHDGKEILSVLSLLRHNISQSQPAWKESGLKCIETVVEILQTAKLKGASGELISDNCC